jgi:AcrR family transcriptional regulator
MTNNQTSELAAIAAEYVTVRELANRLDVSPPTVLARYGTKAIPFATGLMFQAAVAESIVAKESLRENLYTVTAKQIAERTGVHEKIIRERYGDRAKRVRNTLKFISDDALSIELELGREMSEYSVSRITLAKQCDVHPETISRHLRGKGWRRNGEVFFTKEDASCLYRKLLNKSLVDRHQLREMLGLSALQFYYLFSAPWPDSDFGLCVEGAKWSEKLAPSDRLPKPDVFSKTGPKWRAGKILPWVNIFLQFTEKFLTPESYVQLKELADPTKASIHLSHQAMLYDHHWETRAWKLPENDLSPQFATSLLEKRIAKL